MKAVNRSPYREFLEIIPHPAIIKAITQRYPVIIEKVEGIRETRHKLGQIIPNLQYL